MPDFKPDDLVRVTKNPPDGFPDVVGKVGFIETVRPDIGMATVQLITLDGRFDMCGGVYLDRIEPIDIPEWKLAKQRFDARMRQHEQEAIDRGNSWRHHLREVAAKFDMEPEDVHAVYKACREWPGF